MSDAKVTETVATYFVFAKKGAKFFGWGKGAVRLLQINSIITDIPKDDCTARFKITIQGVVG